MNNSKRSSILPTHSHSYTTIKTVMLALNITLPLCVCQVFQVHETDQRGTGGEGSQTAMPDPEEPDPSKCDAGRSPSPPG